MLITKREDVTKQGFCKILSLVLIQFFWVEAGKAVGAYSRWALIRGWALIRINTVYVLPVTCLDDQYCGCTPRRHDKCQREKIQCANNPVTQSRDCRVCLSICTVFPLSTVLKSQQCLHNILPDETKSAFYTSR